MSKLARGLRRRLAVKLAGAASCADLGGSSNYCSENLQGRCEEGFLGQLCLAQSYSVLRHCQTVGMWGAWALVFLCPRTSKGKQVNIPVVAWRL